MTKNKLLIISKLDSDTKSVSEIKNIVFLELVLQMTKNVKREKPKKLCY